MFINIIKSYRNIVAICDAELIGKKFEEEKFQLDVKESFFKGELTSEEKALEIIKDMRLEDATFNIVGEKSVSTAIKSGIIKEEDIGKISGIPYALRLL
jgi:uncharacterized protein